MSDNLEIWSSLSKPPATALRQITGGRLNGKTDIKPQWRYQAMTEKFGPCGIGWKYTIDKLWTEQGADGQVFAFALVSVFVKWSGEWSEAIPGQGGSMLVEKEKAGLFSSDEGFKMAITDALSVSLKMLGVAAEVYMGNWDGSKFKGDASTPQTSPQGKPSTAAETNLSRLKDFLNTNIDKFSSEQKKDIHRELAAAGTTDALLNALRTKAEGFLRANAKAEEEAAEAGGFGS